MPQSQLKTDICHFFNRFGLHSCSAYCLTKLVKYTVTNPDGTQTESKKWACGLDFGTENKSVKARSGGKPPRIKPQLSLRNDITVLEPERDHPRLVAGSQKLMRGYSANYDFQGVLAPLNDVYDLIDSTALETWIERYTSEFENSTNQENKRPKGNL